VHSCTIVSKGVREGQVREVCVGGRCVCEGEDLIGASPHINGPQTLPYKSITNFTYTHTPDRGIATIENLTGICVSIYLGVCVNV